MASAMKRIAVLLVYGVVYASAQQPNFTVAVWTGGGEQDSRVRVAIELAVAEVNGDGLFPFQLNTSHHNITTLNPIQVISAYRETRQTTPVVAILGPRTSDQAHYAGVATPDAIPIISSTATSARISPDSTSSSVLFRTTPTDDLAAKSLMVLCAHFGWSRVAVVRDSSQYAIDGTTELEYLSQGGGVDIVGGQCDSAASCYQTLTRLSSELELRIFIVWASSSGAAVILQEAVRADLLRAGFAWFATDSVYGAVKKLVDQDGEKGEGGLVAALSGLCGLFPARPALKSEAAFRSLWLAKDPASFPANGNLPISAVLSYDAVFTVAHALHAVLNASASIPTALDPAPVGDMGVAWSQGELVLAALRNVSFQGVTGMLQFGPQQERLNMGFDVQNLLGSLGSGWETRLRVTGQGILENVSSIVWPGQTTVVPGDSIALRGMMLKVGATPYPPYMFYDEANRQWSGYTYEVITAIAAKHGLTLEFERFNGSSTALVQAVGSGQFDLGAKSIILSESRLPYAQFSRPISRFAVQMIARRDTALRLQAALFGFLNPFSFGVWLVLLSMVVSTALLLSFFERKADVSVPLKDTSFVALKAVINAVSFKDEEIITTPPSKLLLFSMRACMLVLLTSYTASLVSNIVAQQADGTIAGWEDIQ